MYIARDITVKYTSCIHSEALVIDPFRCLKIIFVALSCISSKRLGMENYQILDSQINASSERSSLYAAVYGRLNLKGISGARKGSWQPRFGDTSRWLKVDFKENVTVTHIETQGGQDTSYWVDNYTVSYSFNGNDFETYMDGAEPKVIIWFLSVIFK